MSDFVLPDTIPFTGDWPTYVEQIYGVYMESLVKNPPQVGPNRRWAVKRYPEELGKHATFWHLTSDGKVEADRLPDLRRCERIAWPSYMIDAAMSGHIGMSLYCWEQTRSGERRVLLTTGDFDYVVVLADRGTYVLVWTAFCVEYEHRRQKLRNEWMASKLAAPW